MNMISKGSKKGVQCEDILPTIAFTNQQEWEAWLKLYHDTAKGIWLKLAKKATGVSSVSYAEAVESALCFGWIDGQKAAFDTGCWLQKFTPRRSKSGWSKINCDKAMRLMTEGKMEPAGLFQIELAKADGRWESAYDSQSTITIPPDFQSELDNNPAAKDFFSMLDRANRYAILRRIQIATKPETRTTRIKKFIEMLAQNQKIYP